MTVVVKPDSILYPNNYSQFIPYRGTSNIIENGDMRVSRIWADNANAGNDVRTQPMPIIDGWSWKYYTWSQATTFGQLKPSTDVPAGTEYLRSLNFTNGAAASVTVPYGYAGMSWRSGVHEIDYLNWGTSQAKTVYLHFWVKSSVTGIFNVAISQNLGNTLRYIAEYTINAANTWEQKTIVIPGPTSASWFRTNNFELFFPFLAGTSGKTATPNTWISTTNNSYITASVNAVQLGSVANATFSFTGVHMDTFSTTPPVYKIDNQKALPDAIDDINRYMMVYGGKGALATPTWFANANLNVALFETDSGNMATVYFRPKGGFASFPTFGYKYWDVAPTAYFHNGAGSFNPNSQSWGLNTSSKDTARFSGTGVTLTTGYGGYISGGYNGQCVFVVGV